MEDANKMLDGAGSRSSDLEPIKEEAHPHVNFKGGVKMAKSSNLQASFTLFKTFIGTGILALPYSYKTAGLGLSLVTVIFVGILTTYCFFLLLDAAADKVGSRPISLQKLTLEILGEKGKHAVQASMLIMQLGCCIGILIFTKSFLNHILCEFEVEPLCDNITFNLLFSLALAVPLCMINNMHYFYIPALAANFFILVGLFSQMMFNIDTLDEHPERKSDFGSRLAEFNILDIPLFFGVATYAFEGVGVIFSIRDSMEKPQEFPILLKRQMVILTLIYIIFPTVSLIAIGDKLQDIIFFSLPATDPFYLLIQILYSMSALFTFPIQLFPALRIIENSKVMRYRLFNENGRTKNKKLRYGLRLFIVGLVFLVAYTANSFHLFLNLLGSCVFTFLGYILPLWMYLRQFQGRVRIGSRVLNYVIIGFTSILGGMGFIMSLVKMFTLGSEGSSGER